MRIDRAEPALSTWRDGKTKSRLGRFLEAADQVDPDQRIALFDNDGTLWCEHPIVVQIKFMVDQLDQRAVTDPDIGKRAEFAAVLDRDLARVNEMGVHQVGDALLELGAGMTPAEYSLAARSFVFGDRHQVLNRPHADLTYRPMRDLLSELRRRDFSIFVVTGGGTEFVRAFARELYGVPTERVIGSLIGYERTGEGLEMRRTNAFITEMNEGFQKVLEVQWLLGRDPILAVGNSAGDREMLDLAHNNSVTGGSDAALSMLVVHDDAEREFCYESKAMSFSSDERIEEVATRSGWTQISMREDWTVVFDPTQ